MMENKCKQLFCFFILSQVVISTALAKINDGLLGYWRFNDIIDPNFSIDLSGNDNHGVVFGNPNRTKGISGCSIAFDGIDDYVEIEDSSKLHSDRQITIAGWFFLDKYPTGTGSSPDLYSLFPIFWKGDIPDCTGVDGCSNREYGLWVSREKHLTFCSTPEGANEQVVCHTFPSDDFEGIQLKRWYHFSVIINSDMGYMRVYLDGMLRGENNSYGGSNIRNTSGPMLFGGGVPDDIGWRYPFFSGRIDEVRIYNTALSEEEIRWLYEIDLPRGCNCLFYQRLLYEYLPRYVAQLAYDGWELYKAGEFSGSFNGGHYTNPDTSTQVHDFWSNGKLAKVDRGDDGHFETIFCVTENCLEYIGTLGDNGTFVEVAAGYEDLIGKYTSSVICSIDR